MTRQVHMLHCMRSVAEQDARAASSCQPTSRWRNMLFRFTVNMHIAMYFQNPLEDSTTCCQAGRGEAAGSDSEG